MSQKEPSLVKSYLHEHRFPALLFLLFALIFAFVFHLYQLETEAVLYARRALPAVCCNRSCPEFLLLSEKASGS